MTVTALVVGLADYVDGGANGGYTPRGTGVVWSDLGYVVTNFHVVSPYLPGAKPGAGGGAGGGGGGGGKNGGGAGPKELRVNVPDVKTGDAAGTRPLTRSTRRHRALN